METKLPVDLSGLIALMGKILTIVGHSPDEIEKHTRTFVQTVLLLTMEKALATLPADKQIELQNQITALDSSSPDQSTRVLTIVNENIPADTLKMIFTQVAQTVLTQYFVSIQPKLTPAQHQEIQAMLAE